MPRSGIGPAVTSPADSAKRPRILVVEDEDDVRRLLVLGLDAVGDVTAAADGLEAYERIVAGFAPDVIVTELMMPRMDGLTLLGRLKQEGLARKVPVVILSAKTRALEVIEGINAGARHYVTKPFEMANLVQKVRSALERRAR